MSNNEWIDVNDRLPENTGLNDHFDVWVAPKQLRSGYREADVQIKDGEFKTVELDGDGDFSHLENISHVTHWIPLPKPPEEK